MARPPTTPRMPPISDAPSEDMSLRALIKATGKTQAQVAEDIGTDPTYVSHMVNGKVNWVNSAYFPALALSLGLTVRQIELLRPDMVTPLVAAAVKAGYEASQPDTARSSVRVRIPVYALAAAGAGIWTDEDIIDYVEVEPEVANRRNRTSFQVDGDSMEPTLSNGDYIHVDLADQDIRHDKIYVVKIKNDGIVVKRAWVYDDLTVELRSDNRKHKPLSPDDAIVIGRVFGFNQGFRPL